MENLTIYNKLKSVPKDCLKTIQAGRLKGMSDIKPQWRIERMTEVFGVCGFGWKIGNLKFDYKNGSDNQIVCTCYLEIFVKLNDVWSDAIPGVGGSSFIANERNGLYTSDEAEKMAYTDALSVAMKMIGVAADVYMGHGGKYETAPQTTIPTTTSKPDLIAGTENCQKVITYLAGGGTIAEVQKKYNISETLLKELTK
jgi:hypothetical protein